MSLQTLVQQLLDTLYSQALNNPGSPYYLPTVIVNGGFAPAGGFPAGGWSVGAITGDGGVQGAQNICADTAPFGQNQIPVPGALPDLQLSDVTIGNLVDVVMPAAPTAGGPDGLTVTGTLSFSDIVISGNFVLTQQCCLTTDLKTCQPNTTQPPQQGSGDFKLSIGASSATAVLYISEIATNVLTIVCNSISYVVNPQTMNASVNVSSIPDPGQRAKWNVQVDKAFNYLPTQQVIISAMNASLGGADARQKIGAALTAQIDSYLQSTHQYPYSAAFGSLF